MIVLLLTRQGGVQTRCRSGHGARAQRAESTESRQNVGAQRGGTEARIEHREKELRHKDRTTERKPKRSTEKTEGQTMGCDCGTEERGAQRGRCWGEDLVLIHFCAYLATLPITITVLLTRSAGYHGKPVSDDQRSLPPPSFVLRSSLGFV